MRAVNFNHVSIGARDSDESLRFCTGLFGLERVPFEAFCLRAKELGIVEDAAWFRHIHELPDGSAQLSIRDPSGNLVEIDWPDASTLDRSVVSDLRRLADDVPQSEEALRSTLFLAEREREAAA